MKKDTGNLSALDVHLQQWQQIGQRITVQLTPMLHVQEALQKSLRPVLEAQEAIQKALGPIISQQNRLRELSPINTPHIDIPALPLVSEQFTALQASLRGVMNPVFQELQRSFHELPVNRRAILTQDRR